MSRQRMCRCGGVHEEAENGDVIPLEGCAGFHPLCYDCGRPYGDEFGFPDLVVPRDVWLRVSPTGHEGGLLCPSCLCKRAYDAGVAHAHAHFASGPFLTGRSSEGGTSNGS